MNLQIENPTHDFICVFVFLSLTTEIIEGTCSAWKHKGVSLHCALFCATRVKTFTNLASFHLGLLKKTHSCTDDDLVLSVWLEPRITVSSLNTFEPVNGLNKRLFYCQNHEVHKQNCYVFFSVGPRTFFSRDI